MSDSNLSFEISKPFGPSICEFELEDSIISELNSYTENIINDKKKSEKLDYGHGLVGQVKQEFMLEPKFFNEKIAPVLTHAIKKYTWESIGKKIDTKFDSFKNKVTVNYKSAWIVRQFENEYNPIHFHTGDVSGVCYTLLPKSFGDKSQKNKKKNPNGCIALVHGSDQFLSNAIKLIEPKIGKFILFPNYMLHTVYPFKGSGERRSFSFNASIEYKK
jgi:hypothetical protein